MSRIGILFGLMSLGTALTLGWSAAAPAPEKKEPRAASPAAALHRVHAEFADIDDNKAGLKDILEVLGKQCGVDFVVNEAAFKQDGLDLQSFHPAAEKPLKGMKQVTLESYLRHLLRRLDGGVSAVVLARKESIEITTLNDARERIWGGHTGPFLALVNASIEKKSLEEALKELAEQAEHNIVLDARVGDAAKTIVTARFSNAPLDTAVSSLADMADLQPVLQDNVIYVTTRDNAVRLEASRKKDMPEDPDVKPRVGGGVRGFVPPKGMGM